MRLLPAKGGAKLYDYIWGFTLIVLFSALMLDLIKLFVDIIVALSKDRRK